MPNKRATQPKKVSSSEKMSSGYQFPPSNLDFFTNNNFSSSFNSLILEDTAQEEEQQQKQKQQQQKQSEDLSLRNSWRVTRSPVFKPQHSKQSSCGSTHGHPSLHTNSPKVRPQRLFDNTSLSDTDEIIAERDKSASASASASQQSSIKRSSKFFNLSLDHTPNSKTALKLTENFNGNNNNSNNNRNRANRIYEDENDLVSDLNDVDSSFLLYSASKPFRDHTTGTETPFASSSPIKVTPFNHNKFKRPHKLVSQSPSPSSQEKLINKTQFFSLSLDGESIDIPKQYSPSKMNSKGIKLLKNADRNAIISPNRMSLNQNQISKLGTTSLNNANLNPNSDVHVLSSTPTSAPKRVLSNKMRKPSLNSAKKSPFTEADKFSSPLKSNYGFENYDWEDMDLESLESPSRNRKNSASPLISVYNDSDTKEFTVKSKRKIRSVPDAISTVYDNKENEMTVLSNSTNSIYNSTKKQSSYKFVKPLQTVFKSTGLKKKNSTNIPNDNRKLPPETPIKKQPILMIGNHQQQTQTQPSQRGSSLSHVISSIHDDTTILTDDSNDRSIEVGRDAQASHDISIDCGSSNFFKLDHDSSLTVNSTKTKDVSHNDIDIEFSGSEADFELSKTQEPEDVLETPTKITVKKSNSFPASFSPVSFNKSRLNRGGERDMSLRPQPISLNFSNRTKLKFDEPSTPINNILGHIHHQQGKVNIDEIDMKDPITLSATKSHRYSSTVDSINSSQATLCGDALSNKTSKIDEHLISKFGIKNIKHLGTGEFSIAYECSFNNEKLAIKRTKKPVIGKQEKKAIMREIEALRALTSVKDSKEENMQEQDEGKEYLVYFIEAWEFNNYYYIMTEFCEGGSLFEFLEDNKNYKIDEFRIWKILVEILNGLKFIHSQNYLHLDLKPANIFITFEGSLKIGDFGLATKLPILEKDFDLEGDRNYIAPELINDKIYTPFADIFSVGLIILEIAANIILPDNGTPWRKLRSGDLSDAGRLSSDNISDFLQHQNFSSLSSYNSCELSSASSLNQHLQPNPSFLQSNNRSDVKELIPQWAPDFLVHNNSNNLDSLVSKLLTPNPFDRPTAKMILEREECIIIENKRKAGATIYEGEFGPAPTDDD